MRDFFIGQMDYIFFVYGLAFLILFFVCISLQKQYKSIIAWNYLGFFGLIHGANEWLGMYVLSVGDNVALEWVRVVMMAVSFICLLEFGRSTCERLKYIKIGGWIYLPLSLVVFSGFSGGISEVNAVVRYSLGFIGGFWASLALWRISRESNAKSCLDMAVAAVAMAVYALAAGVIIDPDLFLKVAGFPIQLLRGFSACVITGMVWRYHVGLYVEKYSFQMAGKVRKLAVGAVITIIFILMLGWLWIDQAGQKEAALQQEKLLRYSHQIAETLNLDLVQTLSGSPSDINISEYQILENSLQQMRDTMNSVRFIYLIRRIEGKNIVLVDSEPFGSKDQSFPGQVYEDGHSKIKEAILSGKSVIDEHLTDQWGTWKAAYIPLVDERSGKLVAILCVKQYAKSFNFMVGVERSKGIVLVGIICLAVLLVFVYWQSFTMTLDQNKKGEKMGLLAQWGIAAIVTLVGMTLTFSLFQEMRDSAWDLFQITFHERAMSRVQNISQEMERQLDQLSGLCRFMGSNEFVGRESFNEYVAPFLKDAQVRAFVWLPRVKNEDLLFYESSAKQDGFDGFQVYEKDSQGKKVPALKRDDYFPVYYLQPWEGNEEVSGFDLASEPYQLAAMERSRDIGRPVATPPIVLTVGTMKKLGFQIFMPVYNKDLPRHTIVQRRKSLKGFVLAVYIAQEFFKGIYSRTPPEGLSCLIEDPAAPRDRQILYRHKASLGSIDWNHPLITYETLFEVPDRQWRLTVVPSTVFIEKNLSKAYWWVLLIGGILTALLAAFLNFLATARHRAEFLVKLRTSELNLEKELLRKKEEDFHLILDSTAEAIYGMDLDGNCTFCNPSSLLMLGYDHGDDLIGKNMHRLIHHSYPNGAPLPVEQCQLYLAIKNNKKIHVEEVFWRSDGASFSADVWSYPELRDGKVVGAVVSFLDITDRKKADDALMQAKETAENALAIKDEFTSTVSHELRTPLAAIKSSIDILDTQVPGPLTGDQTVFIKRVKSNIDRLARLINDVLDLSKLEVGKMVMNLLPFRPEDFVQEVVETQAPVIRNKGLTIKTDFGHNLPVLIADKDRLIQVLNNLINNAMKFTKEGGIVVSVQAQAQKQMIFCVRDTGEGVKEEDMPKLFKKFQQVGGPSQHVGGTGLGLAICKQIIEKHNGRMWVESEFGLGSAFFFSLPLKKAKRILIVDDDQATLEVLKNILEAEGSYEIEMASDGFLAGLKYNDFSPHLIILDVKMPKINGLQMCVRIKSDPKTKNTKIIMLSSFDSDQKKKEAWDAGADEILNKPINAQEMMGMIRKFI